MTSKRHLELVTRARVKNERAIATLREALAMAESGEVVEAAMVLTTHDGRTLSRFSPSDNATTLIGALVVLQTDIIAAIRKVSE